MCYNVIEVVMTKFILIRHGEPRYDQVLRKESYSLGYDFGKLTINGIEQAKKVASDARLTDADIIVSSPFTRALQTAANIASIKNLEVLVENDLHEWIPDINMTGKINGELAFNSYMSNNGAKSKDKFNYETYEELKKRIELALIKYTNYKKVIVVSHGIAISSLTHFNDVIEFCGIREVEI
jgi:broad specificity phosphatase PhoE